MMSAQSPKKREERKLVVMKLNILRADPAGNITVYVLDEVDRAKRAEVAAKIMEIEELKCEQVGFVYPTQEGGDGRMEMMGGEFCGNATRAFGLLVAKQKGGMEQVRVETSGCDHIVTVDTDLVAGTSRAEMPLPQAVTQEKVDDVIGTLVHLGGIAHLIVEDVEPSEEFFARAEEQVLTRLNPIDAYGVIYLDKQTGKMTPLVKVVEPNTLVWEGSCGSGSLAAAVAQSQNAEDGEFARDYVQPAGIVRATVVREGGKVVAAFIGGPVGLGEPMEIEIEL